MKIIVFVVSLLVAFSFITPVFAQEFKTYTSDLYGYKLQYPSDWKVGNETSLGIDFQGPISQVDNFRHSFVNIFVIPTSATTLDELIDKERSDIIHPFMGWSFGRELISENQATLGGQPAHEMLTTVKNNQIISHEISTLHNGNKYEFSYFIEGNGDTLAIKGMLDSFQFTR